MIPLSNWCSRWKIHKWTTTSSVWCNDTRAVVTNVTINGDSTVNGDLFTGNVFEVTQYNHAHHGQTNKVEIQNIKPDTTIVPTTSSLTAESTTVSLANTSPFTTFSGITTDRGEALIEEEIVSYVVGTGELTLTRGVLNTVALTHPEGASIQTYEVGGVSLAGINTTFTVPTNTTLVNESNIDNYYLEFNRTALDPLNQRTGNSLLCFTDEKAAGGDAVRISQNHQYTSFEPQVVFITPGATTDVVTSIRTISGTSANGTEISYVDQGFVDISLSETVFFDTPRLIASTINEDKLTFFPKQKSLALNIAMTSDDENLSPAVDLKNATFIYGRNKINNPVGIENYATDNRANQLLNDPHGSVFVTQPVELKQPATSLKVLIGANRPPEALQSILQIIYCRFICSFTNLQSVSRQKLNWYWWRWICDDIIDVANNDGRPDAFVSADIENGFSEYQFSVDDLNNLLVSQLKLLWFQLMSLHQLDLRTLELLH